MAYLQITDGSTTVDFLDTATLYLARNGWEPRIARENDAGDGYEDVVEVIRLTWAQTTDDSRDSTLHNIHRLGRKAREYGHQRRVVNPVWMRVATHSETNSRYALVRSVEVEKLDARHWGPNQRVDLVVTITREGGWQDVAPTSTPTTVVATTTVENQVDGSNANSVTVAAADVPGDGLALPIIQMVDSVAQEKIIIALRAKEDDGHLSSFISHINAADFQNTSNITADAGAPGGSKWERTALSGSGSQTKGAPLADDLQYYTGNFLVYAVMKVSHSNVFTVQVGHYSTFGPSPLENAQEAVAVNTTTNYQAVYLGRITLPAYGEIPSLADPADYYINLMVSWASASTASFQVRTVFIVPLDDGVMTLEPAAIRRYIDSRIERAYSYGSSGEYWETPDIMRGRFLKLKPNHYNKILFYFWETDANGGFDPANTTSVTVTLARTHLGLRGNT